MFSYSFPSGKNCFIDFGVIKAYSSLSQNCSPGQLESRATGKGARGGNFHFKTVKYSMFLILSLAEFNSSNRKKTCEEFSDIQKPEIAEGYGYYHSKAMTGQCYKKGSIRRDCERRWLDSCSRCFLLVF